LGWDFVEIEIQSWLIDTIEVLQVREGHQPAVAKTVGLIRGELRERTAGDECRRRVNGERQMTEPSLHDWFSLGQI